MGFLAPKCTICNKTVSSYHAMSEGKVTEKVCLIAYHKPCGESGKGYYDGYGRCMNGLPAILGGDLHWRDEAPVDVYDRQTAEWCDVRHQHCEGPEEFTKQSEDCPTQGFFFDVE